MFGSPFSKEYLEGQVKTVRLPNLACMPGFVEHYPMPTENCPLVKFGLHASVCGALSYAN